MLSLLELGDSSYSDFGVAIRESGIPVVLAAQDSSDIDEPVGNIRPLSANDTSQRMSLHLQPKGLLLADVWTASNGLPCDPMWFLSTRV